MKEIRTEIRIHASASVVWDVLMIFVLFQTGIHLWYI